MTRAAVEGSGVLLVDKPVGPTSFDVVRAVKKALGVKSAGHTGTLDPNASGLLPVCVGDATRIASFVTDGDKTYEGLVRFGITTDTLDSEGKVLETKDASHLTREQVEHAIASVVGTQAQTAPMFSARRVDGQRLHELARQGIEVEREARDITVYEAELLAWNQPDALVRFHVSKGTYIRVLAEKLGELLGTGAHLAQLRRTRSALLDVRQALPLAQIEELAKADRKEAWSKVLSTDEVLLSLSFVKIPLDERSATAVSFGNPVPPEALKRLGVLTQPPGTRALLIEPEGGVIAVGEFDRAGSVKLARVLKARVGPGHYRGRRPENGSGTPPEGT